MKDGIELIIFDMAGTTIEDRGEVLTAFKAALEKNQIHVSDDFLQDRRGASKKEVLRQCIEGQFGINAPENSKRIDQAYGDFRALLESLFAKNGIHPIQGAESTFQWLKKRNFKIALTTGFYRKVADIILQAAGWGEGMIDASVCSDEVAMGRPAPYMIFRAMEATRVTRVQGIVNVGDTTLDLLSAAYAGARGNVGVLTGTQTILHLGRIRHTHIIPSIHDLPDLLENEF